MTNHPTRDGEPQARYHCPACHHVGRAPLGQDAATCGYCGQAITSTRTMVELVGLALGVVQAGQKKVAYARADAEVSYLLTKLPLELHLEERNAAGRVS